jgi:hypothetical protein
MNKNEYVLLKDLADEFGIDKSNLRKYILDNDVKPEKIRLPEANNQLTLVLSKEQAVLVRQIRQSQGFEIGGENNNVPIIRTDTGIFYIIQLVPLLSPARIKLGYTINIKNRLRSHRTTCPNAKVLEQYPCKEAWEMAAIDSITREGCTLVGNEVYDTNSIEQLMEQANQFFSIMPERER